MKTTSPVDAARIELLLSDLRLPAIKLMWAKLAEQSDKEGWPAARFLAALAEHEACRVATPGLRIPIRWGFGSSIHLNGQSHAAAPLSDTLLRPSNGR